MKTLAASRVALALLAMLCSASALGLGFSSLRTPSRSGRVGENVFVNVPGLVAANNSPSLARNPRQPANLAVAHRVDRPRFSAVVNWSLDGGRSWRPSALPLPAGRDRPFAPDIAFAPDGQLFVTYVNLGGAGNVPDNLWVTSSLDGGRTYSTPTKVAASLAFQPRVVVNSAGTVFLTWLQAEDVGPFRFTGANPVVVLARSDDRGATFSPPVRVSDTDRERVGAATPVIGIDDQPFVLYEDFKTDRRDFENLEGPRWEQPFALVVTRSTDGGKSFLPGMELESGVVPSRRFLVFLPDFPSVAVGHDGAVYVAWSDARNGSEDVFLRKSNNGGATWFPATRVNDNPATDGTAQYLPRVAVAPSGRVDVIFLDRRLDRGHDILTDAFLASSSDGGRSFRNTRVSSKSSDSTVGPTPAERFGTDAGSRLGIVSDIQGALVAWTDSRRGTADNGRQDIVAAFVDVHASANANPRGALISVLLGLAVIFLGSWYWLSKRRASSTAGPSRAGLSVRPVRPSRDLKGAPR